MKLTKSYIKRVIAEELGNMKEVAPYNPYRAGADDSKELQHLENQKETLEAALGILKNLPEDMKSGDTELAQGGIEEVLTQLESKLKRFYRG